VRAPLDNFTSVAEAGIGKAKSTTSAIHFDHQKNASGKSGL
jgi:hypothetical protein